MPHILITACDTTKGIEQMQVHVMVHFNKEWHHSIKSGFKLYELEAKFKELVEQYFDEVETELFTNHQWNLELENR